MSFPVSGLLCVCPALCLVCLVNITVMQCCESLGFPRENISVVTLGSVFARLHLSCGCHSTDIDKKKMGCT